MRLQIEIIKVKDTYTKNSKGGYSTLEVTYKDLNQGGKVGGKKLFSFGEYAHVYEALKNAEDGDQFTLESQKVPDRNGKEWWTWVDVILDVEQEAGEAPAPQKEAAKKEAKEVATKQAWVPDELKQRYIMRQSSLAQAVAFEKDNAGSIDNVLATAETFFNWVTEKEGEQPVAKRKPGRPAKITPEAESSLEVD